MWIKICGITRVKDAEEACLHGADAIGLVFADSPRRVEPEQAHAILRELPGPILKVGVFVDEDVSEVLRVKEYCGLDYVQLHGREAAAQVDSFGGRAIKAVRVSPETELSDVCDYPCEKILLDGYKNSLSGDECRKAFWKNARTSLADKQVIIAGGLDPENVFDTVKDLRPFGVDVSSGVEISPGVKESRLIKRFISRAREAEQEVKG